MSTTKYSLYVGGGTIDSVEPILARYGVNASLMPIHGLFEGKLEYGTKIEIVSFNPTSADISAAMIMELKEVLHQDYVLLTIEPIHAKLL